MDPLVNITWQKVLLEYVPVFALLIGVYKTWIESRNTTKEVKEAKIDIVEVKETTTKVERRGNHLEQLNLEHFVDLYEEILAMNPKSETAKVKLAAARAKLSEHIRTELVMKEKAVVEVPIVVLEK